MSKAAKQIENEEFSVRLRAALKGAGIRPSATALAHEFNLRYWGNSITVNTARNWLVGKSIPLQDKLRVLAEWLHVGADELRFGSTPVTHVIETSSADCAELNMQDREMLTRYLQLSVDDRNTVQKVVRALRSAASVKPAK